MRMVIEKDGGEAEGRDGIKGERRHCRICCNENFLVGGDGTKEEATCGC